MKVAALLLCALSLAAASPRSYVDERLMEKQQNLLKLFVNVQQLNYNQEQTEIGNSFDIYNKDYFTNLYAVKQFQDAYKQGLLPRGEVFYYYNPIQLQQAIQLFDLFYFAKDYDTFYKAACWARERVNEGMFVYALSVAIVKRMDTQGVALPPQSEVYPYCYIHTRALQQAQYYKQQGMKEGKFWSNNTDKYFYYEQLYQQMYTLKGQDQIFSSVDQYDYSYQPYQYLKSQEGRMAYFREDVYLNQQFVYQQIFFPTWFNSQKYGVKIQYQTGEKFYYYMYQLLARYNLERYANYMPFVTPFQFNSDMECGYNPQLQYQNGLAMPARPSNFDFLASNSKLIEQLQHMDRRLSDAIDIEYVKTMNGGKQALTAESGIETLSNIILGNEYSINSQYYGWFNGLYGYFDYFRKMVGSVIDPYYQFQTAPGAIENDSTAMRDPVFYQMITRIVNYFQLFKSYLQPYKMDQLNFQGVVIKGVQGVDKLYTYWDQSEVELFNAITYKQGEQAEGYMYKAYQQMLNYKPFIYNIQLTSEQNSDCIVRVFIGPKYDAQGQLYTFDQATKHFVEMDRFLYSLKSGQNEIKRSSQESVWFVQHQPNTRALFTNTQQGSVYYNQTVQQQLLYTLPQNLLLPKGTVAGQEYILAVAVHQYQPTQQDQTIYQYQPMDSRPLGFPFDRQVIPAFFDQIKNIYFQTATIFHTTEKQVNQM